MGAGLKLTWKICIVKKNEQSKLKNHGSITFLEIALVPN